MIENFVKYYIRSKILPSSIHFGEEYNKYSTSSFINCNSKYHEFDESWVKIDGDTKLSTFSIYPNKKEQDTYLMCFLGNYENYESLLPDFLNLATETNCNLITFNYRGVCRSKGLVRNIHDLFRDGITQVENLLSRGVDPSKIIIRGFSLGGAIATNVVHHFHQRGKKLYLFSDRSFSKVSDVASAWYGSVLKGMISRTLKKFKWEFDAVKFYEQIPGEYKSHINLAGPEDDIIPFKASLTNGLKNIKNRLVEENIFYVLKDFRKHAHSAPLDKIFNKYGQTGKSMLKNLINKVKKNKLVQWGL